MKISKWLLVGSLIAAAGCAAKDATAPPPADPAVAAAGVYYLVAFNNATPPQTYYSNAAGRVEISGGNLVLRADKSYTENLTIRVVLNSGAPPQTSQAVDNGTFAIVASQITFTIPANGSASGLSYVGAISGDVLSYTYDGSSFRYQR